MRFEAFGNNAMERVLWGLRLLLLKAGKYLVNQVFLKKQPDGISDKTEKVEGNCIVCTFVKWRNAKQDMSNLCQRLQIMPEMHMI